MTGRKNTNPDLYIANLLNTMSKKLKPRALQTRRGYTY